MAWALAHGQVGGSGGMLPHKIFENLDTENVSDAF